LSAKSLERLPQLLFSGQYRFQLRYGAYNER